MRQKEIIGGFIRVPIDENYHTYGRIIERGLYAFYDFRTTSENSDLEAIEKSKILFKLHIHRSAINSGGWKIVGKKELPEDLKEPVPFFKQAIGNHQDCSIYVDGNYKKVDPAECIGLERLAVWEHHHVEQRLKDHYNGVRNDYTYATRLNGIL